MATAFQVEGDNQAAQFTLKVHRGEGMALLAMNWKGKPPVDLVGFGTEFREPGGDRFLAVPNRVGFGDAGGNAQSRQPSSLQSPVQKFRWVHFPRNADKDGRFVYRVTPVFMNAAGELSHGEAQTAALVLRAETYPGKLNVAFTRGFVSWQAFVDRYEAIAPISKLLPRNAKSGLNFKPTHPKTKEALAWMGFEARASILSVLDAALADKKAQGAWSRTTLGAFGSTNFSWRGFFVQANNVGVAHGAKAIKPALQAFDDYWNNETPSTFGATGSAAWQSV
jgi:hypothetical protein